MGQPLRLTCSALVIGRWVSHLCTKYKSCNTNVRSASYIVAPSTHRVYNDDDDDTNNNNHNHNHNHNNNNNNNHHPIDVHTNEHNINVYIISILQIKI